MRYGVILAGGSGTRLWPLSRERRPKQLLPIIGGRSLLQLAFERLKAVVPPNRLLVCAGSTQRADICGQLELPETQYLGEPARRDTAAALGLCAAVLNKRDRDAVMAVCTADHLIEPVAKFHSKLLDGFVLAETTANSLVTFGVAPTAPSTAYGYLELASAAEAGALQVVRFCEKPSLNDAQTYFAAGAKRYLWNSGMFVWKASTLLDCLAEYRPAMHEAVQAIADAYDTPQRDQVLAEIYPTIEKISIDYAVMEPASTGGSARVLAIPLALDWLDLGSWNAFKSICDNHKNGNASIGGQQAFVDSRNVLVVSDDPRHLIAIVGCDDLVVVHTADATLVCRADKAQAVKELQQVLQKRFAGML